MAATAPSRAVATGPRLLFGFVAAFLATLTFHQIGLGLLHLAEITRATPWALHPVPPLGVPAVVSLAFWGGVWGIPFVLAERRLARGRGGYWAGAILFGAIFPTLVAWFVVAPLKGYPAGFGFDWPELVVDPIVNGLWGFGTALFLGAMTGWRRPA
jgi:hypothetical protein